MEKYSYSYNTFNTFVDSDSGNGQDEGDGDADGSSSAWSSVDVAGADADAYVNGGVASASFFEYAHADEDNRRGAHSTYHNNDRGDGAHGGFANAQGGDPINADPGGLYCYDSNASSYLNTENRLAAEPIASAPGAGGVPGEVSEAFSANTAHVNVGHNQFPERFISHVTSSSISSNGGNPHINFNSSNWVPTQPAAGAIAGEARDPITANSAHPVADVGYIYGQHSRPDTHGNGLTTVANELQLPRPAAFLPAPAVLPAYRLGADPFPEGIFPLGATFTDPLAKTLYERWVHDAKREWLFVEAPWRCLAYDPSTHTVTASFVARGKVPPSPNALAQHPDYVHQILEQNHTKWHVGARWRRVVKNTVQMLVAVHGAVPVHGLAPLANAATEGLRDEGRAARMWVVACEGRIEALQGRLGGLGGGTRAAKMGVKGQGFQPSLMGAVRRRGDIDSSKSHHRPQCWRVGSATSTAPSPSSTAVLAGGCGG